jgi:protein O-GlcNAc transferase
MNIDMELREAERLAGILRWPQIIEKCRTVLLHAPDNFPANLWLARALAASGRPLESTAAFRAAIEAHRPESCEARIEYATLLAALGRKREAIEQYRFAVAERPAALEWRCSLSSLLADAGLHTDAIEESGRALAMDPNCAPALFNQATSLLALGDAAAAASKLARCAVLTPDDSRVHNNWGLALAAEGLIGEAIAAYGEALRLKPDYARALNNRAAAFMKLHQFDRAVDDLDHAVALDPRYIRAHVNRGAALRVLGKFEESLASYRSAFPDPDALANATDLLVHDLHRGEEAFACAGELFRLAPHRDDVAGAYHAVSQATARWDDYDTRTAMIVSEVRAGRRPVTPFRFLYVSDSPEDQYSCARAASATVGDHRPLWRGKRFGHERIRVAYLSSDFYAHATAYLAAGLFERHDRTRFECFALAYGNFPVEDAMRTRLADAFEHFEDVESLSNAQIAERIRSLEIDVLVDLKGYTGGSRIAVLSRRPAPLQVHFLGYPGTLGASFVDYLIADRYVVPPAESRHYAERIVRMPHTYQVTDDRRRADESAWTRSRAGLPEGGLVFAAPHQAYKLTPAVFGVWMRLLRRFADSTLWLLEYDPAVRQRLRDAATARGMDPARIVFAPPLPQAEHLARLRVADLLLDTWPYGAHTTASDALWMGLPCVALSGRGFASRVSGSILTSAGLPALIAHSIAEYESLIVGLCSEPGRLRSVREGVEANVRRSPLFDTGRFTRALEDAYVQMWERHQAGLEPADIDAREPPR